MVKADLTQDYYGDLELQPGADTNEIKKQFKKLALRHHPDRNPGRESEANSKFQTIQAAHEVLTDPEQRAKYDAGRSGRTTRPAYGGYKPAQRGNPYSSAGSEWAPPPKPPGTPRANPAPSAGSSRYQSWKPPPAHPTARKPAPGSTAAKNASAAWSHMKHGSGSKARPADIPTSGRAESNATKHSAPPKSDKPGRDEFRQGEPFGRRPGPGPTVPPRAAGYMPGSMTGDEPPAANTSSYNTTQFKNGFPPPLPPKSTPRWSQTAPGQFKEPRASTPYSSSGGEKTNPFEGVRSSRSNSRNRSSGSNRPSSSSPTRGSGTQKSRPDDDFVGSPPKRTRSHANFSPSSSGRPSGPSDNARHSSVPKARDTYRAGDYQTDTSSDDETEDNDTPHKPFQPRKFATPRSQKSKSTSISAEGTIEAESSARAQSTETRKPSLKEFRRWFRQQHQSEGSNNLQSDGPTDGTTQTQQQGEPTMYAKPNQNLPDSSRPPSTLFRHMSGPAKPLEKQCSATYAVPKKTSSEEIEHPFPHINIPKIPVKDVSTSPDCLNTFEMAQLNIVEQLVSRSGGTPRKASGLSKCHNMENIPVTDIDKVAPRKFEMRECEKPVPGLSLRHVYKYQSAQEGGSPPRRKAVKYRSDTVDAKSFLEFNQQRANKPLNSFSFPVGNETFASSKSAPKAFSNISTESISTTFSPDDWHGKFGVGDYFNNEQGRNSKTTSRAHSTGSKHRGRSPTKSRSQSRTQTGSSTHVSDIDTNIPPSKFASSETPIESPGGTKFSAEQWKQTFKPQTFAPPSSPSPLRARPSIKKARSTAFGKPPIVSKTAGAKAAMVEDPDSTEDEYVYQGRSSRPTSRPGSSESAKFAPMPPPAEPMDIDSPAEKPDPLEVHREGNIATFTKVAEPRNVHVEPSRAEWRTGDGSAPNTTSSLPVQPLIPRKTSPALPPRPTPEAKAASQPEVNNDDEDFADLKDLENIEPLHNPAKGLDSFGDLGSTLPFPSQASSRTVFKTNITTDKLELPNPPRSPQVPSAIGASTRPSQSSWLSYLIGFKAYMAEWDIFNTAMLSHFVARKQQADNMPANWLESRDDQWIEMYRKGCKEDVRVREWYNVACERHADAMQAFAAFRLSMKNREEKEAAWGGGLRKSSV